MSVNSPQPYKGNIYKILFEIFQLQDGFSVGAKLAMLEKLAGQRYVNLTEKQIYEACEKYIKLPIDKDEPMTEIEFSTWIDGKFAGAETIKVKTSDYLTHIEQRDKEQSKISK